MCDTTQSFGIELPLTIARSDSLRLAVMALSSRSMRMLRTSSSDVEDSESEDLMFLSQSCEDQGDQSVVGNLSTMRALWRMVGDLSEVWKRGLVELSNLACLQPPPLNVGLDSSVYWLSLRLGESNGIKAKSA